ncbi:MAG: carboxypeptidase regulatory-like domain-containing protein [Acidobacteriia bacterium]|nr:carboxypeptidase regulatory-like domain-containing protein [Terriglobia bacterium]
MIPRCSTFRIGAVLLLFVMALFLTGPILAQTSRGTVSGTVYDASGAVIPAANVELKNIQTGVLRTSTSNNVGIYRFDAVDLGRYSLKVMVQGFKTFVTENIGVEAARTLTIDVTLQAGGGETVVEVNASADELLTKDAPIRGGSFNPVDVVKLPISSLNPIALARTLPGVVLASGSSTFGNGGSSTQFAVNGQRPRGNNYMLDGTDNNDISVGGPAQAFNITDAVQEFSAQTSNFGTEFGRSGGGVFNVITKSGTNQFHGTVHWLFLSEVFDSLSNTRKLNNNLKKDVYTENVYGFTFGGPIIKNKTFFFGAYQNDLYRSTQNYSNVLPTADAVTKLQSLYPNNPRLALYLNALGSLRGLAQPFAVSLGKDPVSGIDRGSVNFGTVYFPMAAPSNSPQWMFRLDHILTDAHRLSFRYIYDTSTSTTSDFYFPGFTDDFKGRDQNFLFTDTYIFSPTWTNEFRFSYGRIGFGWFINTSGAPNATTLPAIGISNVSAPGIATNIPQYRRANNWLFQNTQSKVIGRHTFRYGLEFLRQLAGQRPPFNDRGSLSYRNSTGTNQQYSAFSNFLDDFSGPSGSSNRNFGDSVYHPNQFRQSYFFQDTWKARPSLSIVFGVRYENYGTPANIFTYPAFAGFDPSLFLVPNKVNGDNNNFAPAFGVAWSPTFEGGFLRKLFGDGKTVWRGGYQVTYEGFFNNLLSNIMADAPNSVNTTFSGAGTGRGSSNFFATLPTTPRVVTLLDSQTSVFDPNIRNPYTERWSFGLQRELPQKILLDVSYVGTASHKQFTSEDLNYRKLDGTRVFPAFGIRRIRASEGNMIYHGLQVRVDRRFANNFQLNAAYSWARSIDSTSEVFTGSNSPSSYTSVPISLGGLQIDRGLSDYSRNQRLVLMYVWDIPGPKMRILNQVLGGWSITGISTFQTGAPFTVSNGYDRNNDGISNDRPDISNPGAPLNTRAISVGTSTCATGWQNPDTSTCVTPNQVHFIQGLGLPNASTVGRNTLFAKGVANFDMDILKTFKITESKKLEFRLETFNIFNHPQYTGVPSASVVGTTVASPGFAQRFLNSDYLSGGTRSMRVQLKILF